MGIGLQGVGAALGGVDFREVASLGRRDRKILGSQSLHWSDDTLGIAGETPLQDELVRGTALAVRSPQVLAWSTTLSIRRGKDWELPFGLSPPWTEASADRVFENVGRLERVTGKRPRLRNLPNLFRPPSSTLLEGDWVRRAARGGSEVSLDLTALLVTALSLKEDPVRYLGRFPLEKVREIVVGGAEWKGDPAKETAPRLVCWRRAEGEVPSAVWGLLRVLKGQSFDLLVAPGFLEEARRQTGQSAKGEAHVR